VCILLVDNFGLLIVMHGMNNINVQEIFYTFVSFRILSVRFVLVCAGLYAARLQ
jgi:hypothetical protein